MASLASTIQSHHHLHWPKVPQLPVLWTFRRLCCLRLYEGVVSVIEVLSSSSATGFVGTAAKYPPVVGPRRAAFMKPRPPFLLLSFPCCLNVRRALRAALQARQAIDQIQAQEIACVHLFHCVMLSDSPRRGCNCPYADRVRPVRSDSLMPALLCICSTVCLRASSTRTPLRPLSFRQSHWTASEPPRSPGTCRNLHLTSHGVGRARSGVSDLVLTRTTTAGSRSCMSAHACASWTMPG
jgi:hypothetical protein